MARFCVECGNKISFIESMGGHDTCRGCLAKQLEEKQRLELVEKKQKEEAELAEKNRIVEEKTHIINDIVYSHTISDDNNSLLKKYNKDEIIGIYFQILKNFESDKEVSSVEIKVLQDFQNKFGLSNDNIWYESSLLPHIYISQIREENTLPTVNLKYESGTSIVSFKKGEIVHFGCPTRLKEVRVVNLGYQGGSQGISLRVLTGVNYRIGAHKGHIKKEEQLVETSTGYLLITNKRLLLNPDPGKKAVNIPLSKIISYNCYNNGLEIFKDGREKSYFFSMLTAPQIEIIGICLGNLLKDTD
jgi:hypothetical protein